MPTPASSSASHQDSTDQASRILDRTSAELSQSHQTKVEAVRALARASRILERASGELSLAHYRVLSAVATGDERASRVATRLAIGKPTISATVEALCQRGLLVRSEVEGDQRAAALAVTEEGAALLARVEMEMIGRIDELCARTPDPAQLIESLVRLGAAIDETQAERMAQRRGTT